MVEVMVSPGDYEKTRIFLSQRHESGHDLYFLVKAHNVIEPGDHIAYTCGIHVISALIDFRSDRTYDFAIVLAGTPGDNNALAGLEDVVKGCVPPDAYSVSSKLQQAKSDHGLQTLEIDFVPKKRITIEDALAFGFHLPEFASYIQRLLTEVIDSKYDWRLPKLDIIFQSGQLEAFSEEGTEGQAPNPGQKKPK